MTRERRVTRGLSHHDPGRVESVQEVSKSRGSGRVGLGQEV